METASHAGHHPIYGEQDKSGENIWQLAQCFHTPGSRTRVVKMSCSWLNVSIPLGAGQEWWKCPAVGSVFPHLCSLNPVFFETFFYDHIIWAGRKWVYRVKMCSTKSIERLTNKFLGGLRFFATSPPPKPELINYLIIFSNTAQMGYMLHCDYNSSYRYSNRYSSYCSCCLYR